MVSCSTPLFPRIEFRPWYVLYGLCVDVFRDGAWREGVVFDHEYGSSERSIFFPDAGDELSAPIECLRITQDWDEFVGKWKPRGVWLFLEVLEELEEIFPENFTVEQVWSDLKAKKGLKNLKNWNSSQRDDWKNLILEVCKDKFHETLDDHCPKFRSSSCRAERLGFPPRRSATKVDDQKPLSGKVKPCAQKDTQSWMPAGFGFVSEPEFCPEAISEYYINSNSGDRPAKEVKLKARNHLLYLGWKIEFMRYKGTIPKLRYISPAGECYISLVSVCKYMRESPSRSSHSAFAAAAASSSSSSTTTSTTTTTSSSSFIPLVVEGEYCPQSALDYYSFCSGNKSKHLKLKELSLKAKKHLAAVGWSIYYCRRGDGKEDLRYDSPSGKQFYSLVTACKSYVDKDSTLSSESLSKHSFDESKGQKVLSEKPAAELSDMSSVSEVTVEMGEGNDREIREAKKRKYEEDQNGNGGSGLMQKPKKLKIKIKLMGNLVSDLPNGEKCPDHSPQKLGLPSSSPGKNPTRSRTKAGPWLRKKGHHKKKKDDDEYKAHLKCKSLECRSLSSRTRSALTEVKYDHREEEADDVCSVCRSGGELILCDQCPSAFHKSCLGMESVGDEEGEWFCPFCRCGICARGGFKNDEKGVHKCHQCEGYFHVGCLVGVSGPQGIWFCNRKCLQIFTGLQKLMGKKIPTGKDNITWTLLKIKNQDYSAGDTRKIVNKLTAAAAVMHECFQPIIEHRTGSDLAHDVIYSRESKLPRLNFRGFYTIILEKNQEVVTAANLRVYGEKVAELPLVATAFKYRRMGMCRVLMDVLEKKLVKLGVGRMVLPAAHEALSTWTNSFGFSELVDSDRRRLEFPFLTFPCSVVCQKLLPVRTIL